MSIIVPQCCQTPAFLLQRPVFVLGASPCELYGREIGTETGFSSSTSVSRGQYHSTGAAATTITTTTNTNTTVTTTITATSTT